ncbi:hypothetical protein MTR_1g061260 [Medicago truncatula]|uniref:Uncharacterized protein n=1 Tax=Medicago truncatula TaxID=3880 RepID=A0A072VKZ9_MEDTR|nr:hypothetical protein MTR_1g061260 [Medicago truncatula]
MRHRLSLKKYPWNKNGSEYTESCSVDEDCFAEDLESCSILDRKSGRTTSTDPGDHVWSLLNEEEYELTPGTLGIIEEYVRSR